MADLSKRLPENVEGSFFVDSTCIDCDTCRQIAPATFGDNGESSFVQLQPRSEEERRAAYRALVACPTASIGASDKSGVAAAVRDFPLPLAPGLFYCGFNSHKSFGEAAISSSMPMATGSSMPRVSWSAWPAGSKKWAASGTSS
jgi:ferredoxin